MPPNDDATVEEIRAETGGTVPVVVDVPVAAPVELPVDPNALIAADVEIARQQEETERARIEARKEIKVAEIEAEAPPWLNDLQASLLNLETRLMAMESRQSSAPENSIVIATEPATPVIAAEPVAPASGEAMPEPSAVVEPAAEAAAEAEPPARQKRRWI